MLERFPKAPITEALIDLRVEMSDRISVSQLESLHTAIKEGYPDKKARRRWEQRLEFREGKEPVSTEAKDLGVDGYLFWAADEKQVVQFRLDGFTFSRLRPYLDWSQISGEAANLWNIYVDGAKPVHVTRLALRFINEIEIPLKTFELEQYFTSPPKAPPGLPQILEHFFSRILIQFPEDGAKAFVTLALSDTKDPLVTRVLLDIDAFMDVQLSPMDIKIWDCLAVLRRLKNEVFRTSLRERTLELFR